MPQSHAHGGAETVKENPAYHTVDQIEGLYRAIPTMQLSLAWWLYRDAHITRRQLRVFFGLHEMAERRRWTKKTDGKGALKAPCYQAKELAGLVGGRGSDAALAALRSDVTKLAKIGLATVSETSIQFARSPDQINVGDLSAFWTFWDAIPNKKRSVPIPRRTLRALAAGFTKAVTGVVLALMIRSIHWHKREGTIRHDGRTKGSWIAKHFGISRRAVSDARTHLIAINWLKPLYASQVMLNKFGVHDAINVNWSPPQATEKPANAETRSATPQARNSSESATPLLNRNLSSTKKTLNNRKLETDTVPDHHMMGSRNKNGGGRRRVVPPDKPLGPPKLHAIDPRHLADTEALLELHKQAVEKKLADDCEGGRIDFFAMAERARSRGQKPAALFMWLLREKKTSFVTIADEDAARRRLRKHFFGLKGDEPRQCDLLNDNEPLDGGVITRPQDEMTDDDRFVLNCIRICRKARINPFRVAREKYGWTQERWDAAREHYELRFGVI